MSILVFIVMVVLIAAGAGLMVVLISPQRGPPNDTGILLGCVLLVFGMIIMAGMIGWAL